MSLADRLPAWLMYRGGVVYCSRCGGKRHVGARIEDFREFLPRIASARPPNRQGAQRE